MSRPPLEKSRWWRSTSPGWALPTRIVFGDEPHEVPDVRGDDGPAVGSGRHPQRSIRGAAQVVPLDDGLDVMASPAELGGECALPEWLEAGLEEAQVLRLVDHPQALRRVAGVEAGLH